MKEYIIAIPIRNKYHQSNGEEIDWYYVCRITKAEIAFLREEESGESYIDLASVVIGFLSKQNAEKHKVSTGKLEPFSKTSNEYHFSNILFKGSGKSMLSDIIFDYPKQDDISIVHIGEFIETRIPYVLNLDKPLLSINKNIFNIVYVPETNLHRKSHNIESIFNKFYTNEIIESTETCKITKGSLVFSNEKLQSIDLFGDTIDLEEVYSYEFRNYPFPSCFIYSFKADSKISIKNIDKIV